MTTITTHAILRRLIRRGYTVGMLRAADDLPGLACREHVVSQDEADGLADWPICWCGCGRPASAWESDGSAPAHGDCTSYAIDDGGQPVCACDDHVQDDGAWTGGRTGTPTGWVSRLVVYS